MGVGARGTLGLGLVDLTFWRCWARCPKICFVGIRAVAGHVGVGQTIKRVAVAGFDGVKPHLLDWKAKTNMVEANQGANAGEINGVVQANVGQKLVKGNILRVFTMSQNQDPQATVCLNDA